MKLYTVPLAPHPTRVMLYIAEREALGAKMPIKKIIVNTLKGEHRQPEHLARNPFGTLPVLQLDDGSYLCESLAIIDYLQDKFPEHRLGSSDIETRAHERDIERIVEIRAASFMNIWVHMAKSPLGLPPNPTRADELQKQMQAGLDYIDALLGDGRPFLCGDRPTLADCTLAAALQFTRFTELDIIGTRPHIRQWNDAYRHRPEVSTIIRW